MIEHPTFRYLNFKKIFSVCQYFVFAVFQKQLRFGTERSLNEKRGLGSDIPIGEKRYSHFKSKIFNCPIAYSCIIVVSSYSSGRAAILTSFPERAFMFLSVIFSGVMYL